VSPGWIWTREVHKAAAMDGGGREKWDPIWGEYHMLGRCGEPVECAGPVLFLLSDDASFITAADLAIGAAGTTTWERCSLGLPAIMTAVAENQAGIAQAVHEAGVGVNLGESSLVTSGVIVESLKRLIDRVEDVKRMSIRCLELMGDVQQGGVRSVVAAMLQESDRAA